MDDKIKIELWITPLQEEKWTESADKLGLTIFEYIRRTVDAYHNILNHKCKYSFNKTLIENFDK